MPSRRGALLIRGPCSGGPCSGSRLCGAARRALHRVRDTIASAARMSEAIDGRHEKNAPACRVSAEIMTGDRCAWRKNSPLSSVCFYQSSPLCKNISVFTHPKSPLSLSPSHPTRGAYHDRHGRRGGMRWTRQRFACDGIAGRVERLVSDIRHADERRFRGRQNRVVLTPRRWRQVCGVASARPGLDKTYPQATVAKEPGHRGARHKLLKPLRAGMPGVSGVLVVTRVRSTTTKCARGRGCSGHSAFPTPSVLLGGKVYQRLGRIARRGAKLRLMNTNAPHFQLSSSANGSAHAPPDEPLREDHGHKSRPPCANH
jgi:hypothetical protein